jgi:hypothetical protein
VARSARTSERLPGSTETTRHAADVAVASALDARYIAAARMGPAVESTRLADERGSLEITSPSPGVLLVRFVGHARSPIADAIILALDAAVAAHGSVTVFDDWYGATGYDSAVRLKLTDWTRRNAAALRGTHVLVGSRLIAMGLSVASLALGKDFHTYSNRVVFEAVLAATAKQK